MKLQVGVKALIQNSDGEYLFLRRSKVLADETKPHWDIPGGRIEINEDLMTALEREISEETGLSMSGEPVLLAAQDIFVPAADLHVVRLTYSLESSDEGLTISHEHSQSAWMKPSAALASNVDPYVARILEKLAK